jgi:hypothetical protein
MPTRKPVELSELATYPQMTRWFGLGLLARLAWRVAISELFGQYADNRLMIAALDTVSDQVQVERAVAHAPGGKDFAFKPDAEGALWIDYVADLGDGFDSTYAIASLLARETLIVGGRTTQRGRLLVMGGDEVYPTATSDNYHRKLRDPYDWAWPDRNPKSDKGPLVFAVPGNHDWYDGLVLFLGQFTRKQRLHLGGWRTRQNRSYFALKLTETWWLWGVDAQLDDTIDQPQRDYFAAIAAAMPDDVNVILCGPEPGWLYTGKPGSQSLAVYDLIGNTLREIRPHARIPLVLSGDTHHYSRYRAEKTGTHFVTSGGGGAFLHPTHQLADEIAINTAVERKGKRRRESVEQRAAERNQERELKWARPDRLLALQKDAGAGAAAAYPSREESAKLLRGVLAFAPLNWSFAGALGVAYALAHWLAMPTNVVFSGLALWALMALALWRYTRRQEGPRAGIGAICVAHAAAHAACFVVLSMAIARYGGQHKAMFDHAARLSQSAWTFVLDAIAPVSQQFRENFAPFLGGLAECAAMTAVGGVFAGCVFGAYLYVTSRWCDINHNDAFSAMRRNSHRHFLRIRIEGDEATIYPVGLDRTPARKEWRLRMDETSSDPDDPSVYFVEGGLACRLIETPVVVRAKR